MAEQMLQRWSVSSERRLFVQGVALALASFKEEKETCFNLVWLTSSICPIAYMRRSKKKKSHNKSNDIYCYAGITPDCSNTGENIIAFNGICKMERSCAVGWAVTQPDKSAGNC